MSKYDPLRHFLAELADDSWTAGFAEVEKILGFALPQSAHRHQAWWANESNGSHSHSQGWQGAGWQTRGVNLQGKSVRFERRRTRHAAPIDGDPTSPTLPKNAELMQQAREMTGIRDRDKLIEAALAALIQREAGRHLAALGGAMPKAWAPERDRPHG